MSKTPFKMRSGNATPFKQMGSSPLKGDVTIAGENVGTGPMAVFEYRNQEAQNEAILKANQDAYVAALKESQASGEWDKMTFQEKVAFDKLHQQKSLVQGGVTYEYKEISATGKELEKIKKEDKLKKEELHRKKIAEFKASQISE